MHSVLRFRLSLIIKIVRSTITAKVMTEVSSSGHITGPPRKNNSITNQILSLFRIAGILLRSWSRASEQKTEPAKKTPASSKLGRADSNAAAISQLVAFVKQIDDIETELDAFEIAHWKLKHMSKADVQRRVPRQMFRIGKAPAQAASRHHIGINCCVFHRPLIKTIGGSPRSGKRLIMIQENIVMTDKIQLVLIKEKLGGGYSLARSLADREIEIT